MERIKRGFFRFLPFVISIVLFFVPFFWFEPGEVNLGGDSSRLYLLDPVNYLRTFPLYSVAPGGIGVESISFFFIPFTLLFVFFKTIFRDPHLVVNVYHGLMLVFSYLFVDLSIKKLFVPDRKIDSRMAIAAAIAGLFYVFAPTNWNWDKAISSHNQIFLNPLVFFLILQFLITNRNMYLLLVCFVTLLFAPNFSFIAAPPLFSFYPIALGYLLLYQIYIRKIRCNWKPIILFGMLFISVQAFHLVPQAAMILDKSSNASQRIFSTVEKDSGLQYFLSVASSVKLSKTLAAVESIPYGTPADLFMFVFPFLVIIGLLLLQRTNERAFPKRMFLLTLLFFLVALFFDTANITGVGLAFYSQLFKLPGFSMFRNFHGQFMYVYSFFYALVLGGSTYLVLLNIHKFKKLFVFGLSLIVLLNGWPLLSGYMVNLPIMGIKDTRVPLRIDPQFEKTLTFIRNLPIDGKFLTLPLTDHGYEMLSGTKGGMYLGPSIIGYLTGKKDFMGYQALQPFSQIFLEHVRSGDYEGMKALLARLNIRYIFYNSDPAIYDKRFSTFPYEIMMQYFPNQESVREFIDRLGVKKIYAEGNYSIFEVEPAAYLPHIFAAQDTIFSSDPLTTFAFLGSSLRSITAPFDKSVGGATDAYFHADLVSPLAQLLDNYHLHRHDPFVTRQLHSPLYVFAIAKEAFEMNRKKTNPNGFLDFNLFYSTKRIAELEKYGRLLPVTKQRSNVLFLDYVTGKAFYSWEASLARYEQSMAKTIQWVKSGTQSEFWKETASIKISEQISHHQLRLENAVASSGKPEQEVEFLLSRIDRIITSLRNDITIPLYDPSTITYELDTASMPAGNYEVYVQSVWAEDKEITGLTLTSDGQRLSPMHSNTEKDYIDFGAVFIPKELTKNFVLMYAPQNLAGELRWYGFGSVQQVSGYQELTINNTFPDITGGLISDIRGLAPKSQYILTLEYLTKADDIVIKLFDKEVAVDKDHVNLKTMKYFEKQLTSGAWQTQQFIWTTSNYPSNLYVQIISSNNKPESSVAIRNLTLTKISYPKLIFKRLSESTEKIPVLPKITFTKINPTKYRVRVAGAVEPFTLVFSEEYNDRWKVYLRGGNARGEGMGNYIADNIGAMLTRFFSPEKQIDSENAPLVSSYFNGDIRELKSENIFINASVSETWGKKHIAGDRHTIANGYANAWRLEPQDVDYKKDYELIIELSSQRIFYLGLGISIIGSILGILLYLRSRGK